MVNVSPSVESLDLSLTIFSNEIPVVGDTKTELSATITFKLKNYKGVPVTSPESEFSINWGQVRQEVLPIIAIGGIVVAGIYFAPEAAAATVVAKVGEFILSLLGKIAL